MSPPRGWHISLSTWSDAFLILLSFDDTVMPDSYLDGAQEMSRLGLPSYYHTYQTMKSQEIGRPTDRGQGKVFFLALGWVIAREPTAWWPPWQTLANVDNMFFTKEGHCTSRRRCGIIGLAFAEVCRDILYGDAAGGC
ncbi:hypothetical protein C8J56DRAFT_886646 [Mycena floridula]|nr:hypothetical protein C8J56DRAFT_886646 [Mycena floridula]